ncbi:threonine dehydratase [Rhodobium gokarnense]|uniref:Threonine dehydratase n=1 Tax=Rhodobium gokarnense TaxID=364296 RepID=A0ABT3HCE0_9HYPH|nr:threonine dehydratase [Rhodobium gokarnense]MCW2308078.1 threonine dehydratase [Rhodobium gokarnense]
MLTQSQLDAARDVVYQAMAPTPAYRWPLLAEAAGTTVVVKHENMTPIGAFKVRGGLVYVDRLKRERPHVKGIVSATRGNHGQSLAYASGRAGVACTIVVPEGNSKEKNAAMRAFGADVVEHGADFDAAIPKAMELAEELGYEMVPSFAADLVAGVATYSHELLTAAPDLDVVFVPIGLGSGICGMVQARNLLGHKTEIVGVVSDRADAYAQSFEAGERRTTETANTFADGVAVRTPSPEAFAIIKDGVARVARVSDEQVADAMRLYFAATHTVAEGAGAVPLAAVMAEKETLKGKTVGVVLSGQNLDSDLYAKVLSGGVPTV